MIAPRGDQARTAFSGLRELGLDETLLSWSDVSTGVDDFEALSTSLCN